MREPRPRRARAAPTGLNPGRLPMTGLGRMLSEAREARGLTLEQAERDTRIVRRYLVALEQEDLDAFPAEVYARGFLRSYGSYLGLNPAELLALLPRDAAADAAAPRRGRAGRGPQAARRTETPRGAPGRPWLEGAAGPLLVIAAILFAGLAIGALAGGGPDPADPTLGGRLRPGAGTAGSAGTAAGAAAPGRMPDLRGVDEVDALGRLQAIGVAPFVIEVPAPGTPAGQVVRQSPKPNEIIGTATVTIVVSRGG